MRGPFYFRYPHLSGVNLPITKALYQCRGQVRNSPVWQSSNGEHTSSVCLNGEDDTDDTCVSQR